MIESLNRLVEILRENPVVESRVYPAVRPERAKGWPCVVYNMITGLTVDALEGNSRLPMVQIDIYGKTLEETTRVFEDYSSKLNASDLLVENIDNPIIGYDANVENGVFRVMFTVTIR